MLGNMIVIVIIAAIVAAAIAKIAADKKNGVKCMGCPYSKTCPSKGACAEQFHYSPADNSPVK